MKPRLIHRFAQSQKYRILCVLKQRGPLSVPELRNFIPLSYMGIKQHCVEMESDGYLIKKRKSKIAGRGRPHEIYELTIATAELFPYHDTIFTRQVMSALKRIYGTNAPEKVLFTVYQDLTQEYRKKMNSILLEDRLKEFVSLRQRDGYLLEATPPIKTSGWLITESHSPIAGLLKEFPILLNFELHIYQKTLHPQVRQLRVNSHPYKIVYEIPNS